MIENIIVIIIVMICGVIVGKKIIRQIKNATDPSSTSGCCNDCSNCSTQQTIEKCKEHEKYR